MTPQGRAAHLVAAIGRLLDLLVVYRRQPTGLKTWEADDFLQAHREATHMARLGGFPELPDAGQARLRNYDLSPSAIPYPNKEVGKEFEAELRAIGSMARAAIEAQADQEQERGPAHVQSTKRRATHPKRSTERGEGRKKIIAAVTLHHQYRDGGCGDTAPISVRSLATKADVSPDTASAFFKKEFGDHAKYRAACRRNPASVATWLKLLNADYSPHPLFGSIPPEHLEREENDS
jgi:hypothetical protein